MATAGKIYDAPLITPLSGGLYQAATIIDDAEPSRLADGVLVRTFNCNDGYGLWDITCGAEVNPDKTGDRTDDLIYTGTGVWAADECGLKNPDEAEGAARQTLRLQERSLVEGFFAAQLLADTATPLTLADGEAPAFVRAIGQLSAAMGYLPGVIHAPLRFYEWAAHYQLLAGVNGTRTPSGHAWAFGAGYDDVLDDSLIITGPVVVHRGPEIVTPAIDATRNKRLVVAEREVVVTRECAAFRVLVPTGA